MQSKCGNTSELFAFVTIIFAIFRTMFMVSLNKIGTRVLEHEPKAWVAFLLDTRYVEKTSSEMPPAYLFNHTKSFMYFRVMGGGDRS